MVDCIFIPLSALVICAAFGAVSIAWDSSRRATRSMCALYVATGVWASIDLLAYLETDPERALGWMRFGHVGPLMVGPATLWIVTQTLPQVEQRLETHARIYAILCLIAGVALAFVPGVTLEMIPTDFGGWMPRYGPVSMVVIPLATVLPVYALFTASRAKARSTHERVDRRRVWGFRTAVVLSLFVALPTEFVFPLLEVPLPRLGALAVACAASCLWLSVVHESDDLRVTPQGVARSLLARLRDGVALISLDGTVVSSNERFRELTGRTDAGLVGLSIADLVDVPLDRIVAGVEDRESSLREREGEEASVSISSSMAYSRSGAAIGVVVVFRDRREIDALRRQILTSGRLAAVGELAAGIAHEVNNPVAFIRSDLNLLAERMSEVRTSIKRTGLFEDGLVLVDRCRRRVAAALEGIEHVTEVVVDVREFAHVGGAGQGGSDPESVVEGAMRLARLQRGDDVTLRIASVAGSDRIDSGQEVKQVLLALMRTLADAARKGGTIDADLRTTETSLSVGLCVTPLEKSSSDLLARFEALAPNSLEGGGAALGFAVAAELVEQLGGRLRAESLGEDRVRVELSVPRYAQGTVE